MALKIETERKPGSRLELRVGADVEEVQKAFDRAFSYLSENARIPGFRPGKAPRAVLERHFTEEAVRELAWQQFMEKSYVPALEELDLRPLGEPELPRLEDVEAFAAEAPLELTVTMAVHPEPELPEYRGLKLVRPAAEVTEEDVEEYLTNLRRAHAKNEPAERDEVQEGDIVTCQVQVVNPETGEELEAYEATFTASAEGENELEHLLVGAKPGGEVAYDLTLGEQPEAPELSGKTVKVQATVNKIEQQVLPELDEAFARQVDESLESVEALREWVQERLAEQLQQAAERAVRSLALMVVDRHTKLDLPEELVQSVTQSALSGTLRDLQNEGLSLDQALETLRDEESGLARQTQGQALGSVRMHYILQQVAREAELEVEEEDLERVMAEYAAEHGIEEQALRQMVEMQPEAEHEFRERALREKVVDFLLEHADIETVPRDSFGLHMRRLLEDELPATAPVEETGEPGETERAEAPAAAPPAPEPPEAPAEEQSPEESE